jgi:uncharacterized protein YwqG
MRPSIRIRGREPGDDTTEVGASKLGGLPDLPSGLRWPRWLGWPEDRDANAANPEPMPENYEDRDAERDGPMCFLGQFRLTDVAPYDVEGLLPHTGMLYVFCALWVDALGESPKDRGAWRVIYRDVAPSNLRRTPLPPDASQPLPCSAIAFFEEVTPMDVNMTPEFDELGLNREETGRYYELLMSQMQAHPWQDEPTHRLLGWPQLVQYDMRDSLRPRGHRDWGLLLQLDTHHGQRLRWQGGGRGYFWIRDTDLRARNFDRTWLMMQCT